MHLVQFWWKIFLPFAFHHRHTGLFKQAEAVVVCASYTAVVFVVIDADHCVVVLNDDNSTLVQ